MEFYPPYVGDSLSGDIYAHFLIVLHSFPPQTNDQYKFFLIESLTPPLSRLECSQGALEMVHAFIICMALNSEANE